MVFYIVVFDMGLLLYYYEPQRGQMFALSEADFIMCLLFCSYSHMLAISYFMYTAFKFIILIHYEKTYLKDEDSDGHYASVMVLLENTNKEK